MIIRSIKLLVSCRVLVAACTSTDVRTLRCCQNLCRLTVKALTVLTSYSPASPPQTADLQSIKQVLCHTHQGLRYSFKIVFRTKGYDWPRGTDHDCHMSSMCRYFRTARKVDRAKPLIAMACAAVAETRQLLVVASLSNNKILHRIIGAAFGCC